ncbi:MAG: BON domain-containing protein, partial [Candidatus Sulfotelmatobacter sp.]
MKLAFSTTIRIALLASLIGGSLMVVAQDQTGQSPADNTRMNQGDQSQNAVTADQQKMNRSDRDITQQIRRSIEKDKSLSTYAHNVKVITQNGMV